MKSSPIIVNLKEIQMKTKHFLTALALPIAFAACTDEQFEGMDNNLANNENRPLVGQVTFVDSEIGSRYAVGATNGALSWAKGDAFGMILMDESSETTGDADIATRFYNLVNKGMTNYPFTNDGTGTWKSEAQLLEGNYFYYFPYVNNQNNTAGARSVSRAGGLRWAIEGIQNAYTESEGVKTLNTYNAVQENQLYVGYQALNADATTLSLKNKMLQVYPTIYFKLVNTDEDQVIVNRVILESTNAENGATIIPDFFNLYAQLNVEDGASKVIDFALADADDDGEVDDDIDVTEGATINKAFSSHNVASERATAWDKTPWANMKTSYWTVSGPQSTISLNFPATILKKDESVAGVMVVPNSLTTEKLQARIYTNKGIVLVPLKVGKYDVTTITAVGETKGLVSYTEKNVDEDAYEATVGLKQYKTDALAYGDDMVFGDNFAQLVPNQGATVTISFNADAIAVPGKMDIYSTDDLDAFLSYCEAANVAVETSLEATLKADGVELSNYAYGVLKGNDKIKLSVLADTQERALTISSDIKGTDALNVLTWDETSPVVNAIVEEGAAQVVNKNFENTIYNKGTLTVENWNTSATPAVQVETSIGALYNVGTLNVATKVSASIYNGVLKSAPAYEDVVVTAAIKIDGDVADYNIENYAKATTSAASIYGINNHKMTENDKTDKVADLTINGDLTMTNGLENDAKVTINANLNSSLANDGEITVAAQKEFIVNGVSSSDGDITNNGFFKPDGTFTNNGEFNNNYGVNVVNSSAKFNNAGTLNVAKASPYTYISDNTGSVVLEDRREELTIANTQMSGKVVYTAVETDYTSGKFETMDGDKFTDLIINKANADLSGVNKNGITAQIVKAVNLDVNTDCEIIFANSANFADLTVGVKGNTSPCIIEVKSTNLTITNSLTINDKTTLHVTIGNNVTYTGSNEIVNTGTVLVGGTFEAPSATKGTGKFEEAGGNITWN